MADQTINTITERITALIAELDPARQAEALALVERLHARMRREQDARADLCGQERYGKREGSPG